MEYAVYLTCTCLKSNVPGIMSHYNNNAVMEATPITEKLYSLKLPENESLLSTLVLILKAL